MTLPHPAVTRMHTMTTTALIAITVRLFADQSRLINLPATITRSTPCCKEPSNARCSAACWAPASAPRPRSTKSTSSFRAAPAALGQHRPRHRRGADQIRPHHHRLLPEHLGRWRRQGHRSPHRDVGPVRQDPDGQLYPHHRQILSKELPQSFRDLTPVAAIIADYQALAVPLDSPIRAGPSCWPPIRRTPPR